MSQTQVEQIASAVEELTFTNESSAQVKNNKFIKPPPTWFDLAKISNRDMLSQIGSITNQFRDLPSAVVNWILIDVNQRPFSYYGTIPAPPSVDLVKQIIGINGCYLKLTTENNLMDFIWHDRKRNEFQFWGSYQRCVKAMNVIRSRICKYVEANRHMLLVVQPVNQHVFYNDTNPHPAVCLEAIIELDEKGEYKKTVASKFYPDAN